MPKTLRSLSFTALLLAVTLSSAVPGQSSPRLPAHRHHRQHTRSRHTLPPFLGTDLRLRSGRTFPARQLSRRYAHSKSLDRLRRSPLPRHLHGRCRPLRSQRHHAKSRSGWQKALTGPSPYNFSYVDQIYDGLLANHVRPFVELSFMPKKMASDPARSTPSGTSRTSPRPRTTRYGTP